MKKKMMNLENATVTVVEVEEGYLERTKKAMRKAGISKEYEVVSTLYNVIYENDMYELHFLTDWNGHYKALFTGVDFNTDYCQICNKLIFEFGIYEDMSDFYLEVLDNKVLDPFMNEYFSALPSNLLKFGRKVIRCK